MKSFYRQPGRGDIAHNRKRFVASAILGAPAAAASLLEVAPALSWPQP